MDRSADTESAEINKRESLTVHLFASFPVSTGRSLPVYPFPVTVKNTEKMYAKTTMPKNIALEKVYQFNTSLSMV